MGVTMNLMVVFSSGESGLEPVGKALASLYQHDSEGPRALNLSDVIRRRKEVPCDVDIIHDTKKGLLIVLLRNNAFNPHDIYLGNIGCFELLPRMHSIYPMILTWYDLPYDGNSRDEFFVFGSDDQRSKFANFLRDPCGVPQK